MSENRPLLVAFEGIDGSGKTTVSNRVAMGLRAAGVTVEHVREGGEFASPVVRRMRDFGRDPRNLALEPWAELLFYLAREAQVQAELTRPALLRGEVVLTDRYFYSYEVLGHHARGLPRDPVRAIIAALAGGLWPDLVVLMDVDPHVARARRRSSKLDAQAAGAEAGHGSRKGLAGVGAQRRMWAGYLELASREPDRWLIVDNGSVHLDVDAVVETVCDAIRSRIAGTAVRRVEVGASHLATSRSEEPPSLENATARFFDELEARSRREPATAAYFLAGLSHPVAYDWRARLFERATNMVADGLRGLGDERAWDLRDALMRRAAHWVARSLHGPAVEGPRAEEMRRSLCDAEPRTVLASIDGDDREAAWELRAQSMDRELTAVVASLKRLDSERAWSCRERYRREHGGEAALARPDDAGPLASSLLGLASAEAWRLRRLAFDAAPIQVLESLTDVLDDESWAWRARWIDRAPRSVLRTLGGVTDPRAWDLRRRHAVRVKEALDSMVGLDGREAWSIRAVCAERWPSTTIKSLGALYPTPRGQALAARLALAYPCDLSLLKHVTSLSDRGDVVHRGEAG